MIVKGMKKRWLFNNLLFMVSVFSALIIIFALITRKYAYDGAKQNIEYYINSTSVLFDKNSMLDENSFISKATNYVNNLNIEEHQKIELMVINSYDKVVATTGENLPETWELTADYYNTKYPECCQNIWIGKSPKGEKLMSTTLRMYDRDNNYIGAIRCAASMNFANTQITRNTTFLMLIFIAITLFMVVSNVYFIKSITYPLKEICTKAKLIAQGDFHVKLNKRYDDEIGELSDTIKYMADELDASEKLKNEFISSVSHELRTPLTAIKGWAETMQMCDSDPETIKKGLNTIVKESERLSWIVEGLLDFSSIKEKRIKLIKEKIDILAEIAEAVYMFKDRANNENKTLIYNEPKMLPAIVGDKNRLRQVFINIIDNALKYTSEGGGISIDAGQKDDYIYISVTDNGCGISQEHLPNVTKKFYKANYLKSGSGIGLAIVDEIITLHGGELNIISEEGFGTTVTVNLPILQENIESEPTEIDV